MPEILSGRPLGPAQGPQLEGGQWGNRLSASIDNYQANLWGLAEAMGSESAGRLREANEDAAAYRREMARRQGAVTSFKDVSGIGSGLNYVGGLAVDSLPYLGEALVGGIAGRGLALGARVAGNVGAELGMQSAVRGSQASLGRASLVGAGVASYPSAVGDILSSQREQSGEMDLLSAGALGVPYAALNALGLEGMIARGALPRVAASRLDEISGVRGGLARAGYVGLKMGAVEGATETGQEFINQMGRNVVDPNAGYFGPEALDRYAESFVGGAALGGVGGAAAGGWRRSEGYRPRDVLADQGQQVPPAGGLNESGPPPALGWDGYFQKGEGQTPFVTFPDGSTATSSDAADLYRYQMTEDTLGGIRDTGAPRAPIPPRVDPTMDTGDVAPYLPGVMIADQGGVVALDARNADALYGEEQGDPGLAEARRRYLEQQAKVEEQRRAAEAVQQKNAEFAVAKQRAQQVLGTQMKLGNKHVELFQELERQKTAGSLSEDDFVNDAALLSRNELGAVRKNIAERDKKHGVKKEAPGANQPNVAATAPVAPGAVAPGASQPGGSLGDVGRVAPDAAGQLPAAPGAVAPSGAAVAPAGDGPGGAGAGAIAGTKLPEAKPPVDRKGALAAAKVEVDAATGAAKTVLPMVDPKKDAPGATPETEEERTFRRTFAERVKHMPEEDRMLLTSWLGVELTPDGDLELAGSGVSLARLGAGLRDGKTGKVGISKQAVNKRLRKIVAAAGAPANIDLLGLYRRLGYQLSDLDLETIERHAADFKVDARAMEDLRQAQPGRRRSGASVEEDVALQEQAADEESSAEMGSMDRDERRLDADETTPEAYAEDDKGDSPTESVTLEDQRRSRQEEELDDLADDIKSGRVAQDDIVEVEIAADEVAGPGAWRRMTHAQRVQATRMYASARLRGDPTVLEIKRKRYEREQAAEQGRPGQAADGTAERGTASGDARPGEAGTTSGAGTAEAAGNRAEVPRPGAAPTIVVKKKRTVPPGTKFSATLAEPGKGSTVASLRKEIAKLGLRDPNGRVTIVQSVDDLPINAQVVQDKQSETGGRVQGFVFNGRVYLVADNIRPGKGRSVFMHEVGSHLGLDNLLSPGQFNRLVKRILRWADQNDGSVESRLARKAVERAGAANTPDEDLHSEVLAYFVEEAVDAGIEPTRPNSGPASVVQWIRDLARAFKSGIERLMRGGVKDVTAQDVVDLAYGAAGLELIMGNGSPGPMFSVTGGKKTLADLPPPSAKLGGLKGLVENLSKDGLWRTYPSLLGWLSGEQLAEQFSKVPVIGASVKAFAELSSRMAGRAMQIKSQGDALLTRWDTLRRKDAAGADRLDKLLNLSTEHGIWPQHGFRDKENLHVEDTPENRATHAKLQVMWNGAGEPVRQLYRDLIADGDTRFKAKVAALRSSIVSSFYPTPDGDGLGLTKEEVDRAADTKAKDWPQLIAEIGTTKRKLKELRHLRDDLEEHDGQFKRAPGPYFPLMRFGKHIVAIKSAAYQAAEKAYVQAREALTKAEGRANPDADLDEERKAVKDALAALNKLKASDADYRVDFFETIGEARQWREDASAQLGEGYTVQQTIKDEYLKQVDAVSPTFMRRLEQKLSSAFEGEKGEQIRQAVREMYVQMLPEQHMLKAQLKRRSVAGYNEDAMRTYAASVVRDSHGISRLEFQAPLREALDKLRFDRYNVDSKIIGGELAKRLEMNFRFEDHPILSGLTNVTYMWRLGLSPSFLLTNLTQPWFVSAPIIAARHHFKTFGELKTASIAAAKMLYADKKGQDTWRFQFDPQRALKAGQITEDEALMLQRMLESGRVDITITQDLGAAAEGRELGWLSKATQISGLPAQQLEVLNRVATALAAYRLERQHQLAKNVSNAQALDEAYKYADRMVAETHLNYSAENRARHMHPNTWGGWGRVMWQFRAYQQGMIYLVLKNLQGAVKGDKEAQKAVAYLSGMMLATAGVSGLPGAASVFFLAQALYGAFEDDDEEKDLKQMLYAGIENMLGATAADAVMKGLPTLGGMDISGRVGLGDLFAPVRFGPDHLNPKDQAVGYFGAAVGGASVGLLGDFWKAANLAADGKVAQAAQAALPKVVSDQVRWAREQTEGVTDSRGRVLITPEERDFMDAVARAAGIPTIEDSRRTERRQALFEARENRDTVRNNLLSEFARARVSGKPVDDVLADIKAFNERHPDARITPANREAAVRSTRNRSKELRDGVPVRKQDQGLAAELGV